MLYSLGMNHSDDQGRSSSVESETGDLLLWPPARALARNEGLLD
jgi:hypothetical protein